MVEAERLKKFLTRVRTSDASDFYRTIWKDLKEFNELPTISRSDFLRVPLSKRRYKNEKGIVKIVHDPEGMFLSEWSFVDIGRETFGSKSKRPMVYLSDPHEAIEKSMWCYEQNMLPLIGEKDPDIAIYAASKYQIDSLITDSETLPKLLPFLKDRTPLSSLTILGETFSIPELLPFKKLAQRAGLIWTLPETGAFAIAQLSQQPKFKTVSGSIIESEETLIITKLANLVTPIIRYKTRIPAHLYDGS